MSIAIADFEGIIHVYEWHAGTAELSLRTEISYSRQFREPQSITFSYFHGGQLLLIGSERHEVSVVNLATQRQVARLEHQGTVLHCYQKSDSISLDGCYIHAVSVSIQIFVA